MAEDGNTAQNQPGSVITPGGQQPAAPESSQLPPEPQVPNGQPKPAEQPASPYTEQAPQLAVDSGEAVSWTASEFISHEKSSGWYGTLGIVAIVIAGIVLLFTRDFVSTGVILFVFMILGIYGARQPRQLPYRLDTHGVQIGDKWHSFEEFRSFSVMPEGAFSSIVFMPLKRFAPITTIYYAPEDEEKLVNLIAQALPYEERKHDPVDRLMQRIRF